MGYKEPPHLNGGYYSSSIPPPSNPRRRFNTPDFGCYFFRCLGGCLGGCLRCFGCCIISLICNILIAVAVVLAVTAIVIWLIFRPNAVKFHVTDANMNRFSLDPNTSNLDYDLDLNFTIRNPNQRLGVYYDEINVTGYYRDQRFGSGEISPFYQGHKNTTVIGARIEGRSLTAIDDGVRSVMKEEERSGVYTIDAKVRVSVRFKYWVIKSWRFKPKFKCDDLKVPLGSASNLTSGFKFQPVKCGFDFY
ncbi:unnamed protein product [Cochlearia groenlandica]